MSKYNPAKHLHCWFVPDISRRLHDNWIFAYLHRCKQGLPFLAEGVGIHTPDCCLAQWSLKSGCGPQLFTCVLAAGVKMYSVKPSHKQFFIWTTSTVRKNHHRLFTPPLKSGVYGLFTSRDRKLQNYVEFESDWRWRSEWVYVYFITAFRTTRWWHE